MNTIIKVTNVDNTDAIESYVNKKLAALAKLFAKGDEVIVRVEVGMTDHHHKKGDIYFAEATFLAYGHKFRSVENADDLYAAIDAMKDEVVNEVKAFVGKRREQEKKGGRAAKTKLRQG